MSKIPENPVSEDSDPGPSLPPDPLAREMKAMAHVLSNFSDILANSIRNAISATTVPESVVSEPKANPPLPYDGKKSERT
jgi:hypothetical protein